MIVHFVLLALLISNMVYSISDGEERAPSHSAESMNNIESYLTENNRGELEVEVPQLEAPNEPTLEPDTAPSADEDVIMQGEHDALAWYDSD